MQKEIKTFSRTKGRILSLLIVFVLTIFSFALTVSASVAYGADTPWIDKSDVSVPSSDDYAYSYMVVGDTQYVTQYDAIYNTTYLSKLYKWIANNANALKTKYVLGMGDITHNDIESEYRVAQTAIKQLDGVVPYALIRGNHDNRANFYDKYFGPTVTTGSYASTYMSQDSIVSYFTQSDDANRIYSTTARNTAHEFVVGDTKYLLIALDFGAQDPVLDWANDLVTQNQYKDHSVIVFTHGYTYSDGSQLDGTLPDSPTRYEDSYVNSTNLVTNPFKSGGDKVHYVVNAKADESLPFNDGTDMWNKFIKKHANIKAVYCGHVFAENIVRTEMVGDNGNIVQQIVVNPQVIDDDDKNNGADWYKSLTGMVAIVYCSADGETMSVRYYSTLKDMYYGEQNQFDLRWNAKKLSDGAGLTFVRDTLYSLQNRITAIPKTVEFKLKYDSIPSANQMLVSSFGTDNAFAFAVRVAKNTGCIDVLYNGEGTRVTFDQVNYAGDGKYHDYAITFDDSKAYCYVDGELKQTENHTWSSITPDLSAGLPIAIGGDFRINNGGMNGEYLSIGSLKSVSLYKDIRTAKEIQADMYYTASGSDENAMLSVDLTKANSSAQYTNYGDKTNPVVVMRNKFANTTGMTFNANKLYSFAKSLSAFPKTIEVMMKSAIPSGNKVIVGNYSGTGTNGTEMTLRVKSGGNLSIFYNGEQYSVTFDTKVDGNYHLYSFVMDGANAHLYVDGTLTETKTIPLKGDDTSAGDPNDWDYSKFNGLPWCIGGDNRSENGGAFTGEIRYVTMYSDVRTASEISAMATGNTARIFNYDANALVAVDMASGINGGHIANYADGSNVLYAPGMAFTTSKKLQMATPLSSYPNTIEVVLRGEGNDRWIVGNYQSSSNTNMGLKYLTGNKINLYTCGSGWANLSTTFDTVMPTNRYIHIAVSTDGTKANLYLDGELKETKDMVFNSIWATKWKSALPLVIGGDQRTGNSQALTKATIQSVAFYSNCRSASEIMDSYVNGISENASGLLAGYDFGGYNDKTVYKNIKSDGVALFRADAHNFSANETYLDIADYGVNEDGYLMGQEHTSTQNYRLATYKLWDYSVKGDTNPNIGLEFRLKSKDTKAQLSALMEANNYTDTLWAFMNIRLGHSFIEINLPNDLSSFGIRTAHYGTTEKSSQVKTMMIYGSTKNVIAYEDGAEYVFRFTRTAIDENLDNGYGALLRVYVGKIDPETNMPQANWDATPVVEEFALYERNSNIENECGISVEPGFINHNTAMPHTVIISSNKYCGVKVDGVMNKHERGTEFTFAGDNNTTDNTYLVGYSAGATTYSADDFVIAGGKKAISKSTTFKSLSLTVNADANATARFRNRVVSGKVQPLELALNWGANATFTNDLDTYFSVKFGYNITASNGTTSGDIEVSKVVNNAFSLTQSNIGEDFYDLKFAFRAYVEINGTKYYSTEIDANDGDSVSAIASVLVDELTLESTANKTNAIKDGEGNVIGYHYLTQSQYDLAKRIAQA